jgi:hypothetical protein
MGFDDLLATRVRDVPAEAQDVGERRLLPVIYDGWCWLSARRARASLRRCPAVA